MLTGGWSDEYKLGSGGSGSVYRAVIDGTPVAVKRFHVDTASSGAAASGATNATWLTELQLMTSTSHSNVVPLLGASSDGPAVCLLYEFCDGGSVEQRLARALPAWPQPLSPSQRIIILSDVCRGLAHLHNLNVVHRDIKPANILLQQVQSGCLARIGDFGVARAMETEAHTLGSGTMASQSKTWQSARVAGSACYARGSNMRTKGGNAHLPCRAVPCRAVPCRAVPATRARGELGVKERGAHACLNLSSLQTR